MKKCLGYCKWLETIELPYTYFYSENECKEGNLFLQGWRCKLWRIIFTKPPHHGFCYDGSDWDS